MNVFCCLDDDDCVSHPCLNGAVCQDAFKQYICTCTEGFSGDNCGQSKLSANIDYHH